MDSHKWIAVTSETMLESVEKLMIISHSAGSALSLTMLNHAPVHRFWYEKLISLFDEKGRTKYPPADCAGHPL